MAESNEVKRFPLNKINFVADVTIKGEYKILQLVPFRDRLYLLIERPDTTPELYYVNEETKQTELVKFEGLEPPNQRKCDDCQCFCTTCICPKE